jgi:hypothetical protein
MSDNTNTPKWAIQQLWRYWYGEITLSTSKMEKILTILDDTISGIKKTEM